MSRHASYEVLCNQFDGSPVHVEIHVAMKGKPSHVKGKPDLTYRRLTELRLTCAGEVIASEPLPYGLSSLNVSAEILLRAVA